MKDEVLENLIGKYLENNASVKETKQLETWYISFDSLTDLYVPDSLEVKEALAQRFSELKVKLGIVKQS